MTAAATDTGMRRSNNQDSYAVVDAFVAWQFAPQATLRLNARNITDEKYINTLRYSGYYGAPANYTLSLDWRFR